jgi:hypothetical protein
MVERSCVAGGDAICPANLLSDLTTGTVTVNGTAFSMSTASFTSADVGKTIGIPGAGPTVTFVDGSTGGGPFYTTIAAVISPTDVTLAAPVTTALSAASSIVVYGTDDTVALQAWIAYCLANNVEGVAPRRNYLITGGLVFHGSPEPAWFLTGLRPPKISIMGAIYSQCLGASITVGGAVFGMTLHLGDLIGPGVTAIGTPGGGAENIGLYLPHPDGNVTVRSVSDFNFNVLFDGSWSHVINIGTCYAAIYGVYLRVNPSTGANCNSIRVTFGTIGGSFATYTRPNFAQRQARSCFKGIYVDPGCNGNSFAGGAVEYCIRYPNGVGIHNRGNASAYRSYVEGNYLTGYLILDDVEARDATYDISAVGTPSQVTNSILLSGLGARVSGIPSQDRDNVITAGATGPYTGQQIVLPGNSNESLYNIGSPLALASTVNNNITASLAAFTSTNIDTVTTGVTDVPTQLAMNPELSSTDLSMAIAGGGIWQSGTVAAIAGARIDLSVWVKAMTAPMLVSYLLWSNTNNFGIDAITTQIPFDGKWYELKFTGIVPVGTVGVYTRINPRWLNSSNPNPSVLRVCRPYASFNVGQPPATNFRQLPWPRAAKDNVFMDGLYVGMQQVDYEMTGVDLTSRALNCQYFPAVTLATNSGSVTGIDSITGIRPGGTMKLINRTGGALTLTSATGLPANFVLANAAGCRLFKSAAGLITV